jgi:hypothetical protein
MLVADCQINAEAVPLPSMFVLKVRLQARAEIARQANVIEVLLLVERIHTLTPGDVLTDNVLVFF